MKIQISLSEMFKTPQKGALSAMIEKNYGNFILSLQLAPEQSTALKDLILNKQLVAAETGRLMCPGCQDATKRAELVQQIKVAADMADAQIKKFLGDCCFAQFQAYEKYLSGRMAVRRFKEQLGSGPTALTDDQEEQLIQAMTQERQNFKFAADYSYKSKGNGDFVSMSAEDNKMNVLSQELGRLNQYCLTRARSILSPEQLPAFETYLNNQQTLQESGIQMAMKMFAPTKPP